MALPLRFQKNKSSGTAKIRASNKQYYEKWYPPRQIQARNLPGYE